MSLLTRFLNLFRPRSLNRELNDEVRFHLERRIEHHVEAGMRLNEAEDQAQKEFGDIPHVIREMQKERAMRPSVAIPVVVALIAAVLTGVWLLIGRPEDPGSPRYYQATDEGVTPPSVVREKKPEYPAEAQRAKIQGSVEMKCIVQTTGLCDDVRIAKSLDPMWLDREAVKAIQEWRFRPGTLMGEPVPVMVTVEFSFTVR